MKIPSLHIPQLARRLVLVIHCLALTTALCQAAEQEDRYPTRPIRVVVPYTPGGGADTNSRLLAQPMSAVLGQSLIIENKPGASGVIGAMAVLQASPDGYAVFYDAFPYAVNAVLRKLPFDPLSDFIPVSQSINMPLILVVPFDSPFKSVADLIDYSKKHPNELSYGSYGAGGAAHLAAELLQHDAGVQWVHIPYKGGSQAIADVLAGRLAVYFSNPITAVQHLQSGKLRALATTGTKRMSILPDQPTMTELGYANFVVSEWNGLFAPKGTPPEAVALLAKSMRIATQDAEVNRRMSALGIEPVGSTPAEFAQFLQGQVKLWGDLVKSNNIRAD